MNGWATATCATDGKQVVAFFGRGGIHGFDVDGKKLWSKDLGKFDGPWGAAASPLIVDGLVIQNCDAVDEASLLALEVRTGKVVWQTPRQIPPRGGWSSPVLVNAGAARGSGQRRRGCHELRSAFWSEAVDVQSVHRTR